MYFMYSSINMIIIDFVRLGIGELNCLNLNYRVNCAIFSKRKKNDGLWAS
jgi:hypothetical protein